MYPASISPREIEAQPAKVSTWVTWRSQSKGKLNSIAIIVAITWAATGNWANDISMDLLDTPP